MNLFFLVHWIVRFHHALNLRCESVEAVQVEEAQQAFR
jgi:hypothetical protein